MKFSSTSCSSLIDTAQQRSLGMQICKERRMEARRQRLEGRKESPSPISSSDSTDFESKTRALISAIRSYTNADFEMDVHMAPDKLFEVAVRGLSSHSSAVRHESKLVGETLDVITRLNEVLQKW
jgi:hypothetical protein|tara:strand:- start:15031 stop:15405 length:375 start_codon:yes stop_codon:yes gene_type:complete